MPELFIHARGLSFLCPQFETAETNSWTYLVLFGSKTLLHPVGSCDVESFIHHDWSASYSFSGLCGHIESWPFLCTVHNSRKANQQNQAMLHSSLCKDENNWPQGSCLPCNHSQMYVITYQWKACWPSGLCIDSWDQSSSALSTKTKVQKSSDLIFTQSSLWPPQWCSLQSETNAMTNWLARWSHDHKTKDFRRLYCILSSKAQQFGTCFFL